MYDAVTRYVISKIKLPVMPAMIPAAMRRMNDFAEGFSGVRFINGCFIDADSSMVRR